jgi:hypothetical protein
VENRRKQQQEFKAPLFKIFKPRVLGDAIAACL